MTQARHWVLALAGYFLLQALLRPLYGPALELDEAEAFWFSRHLALGYGAQPPLYFWLQWGFLQTFGETLLALSALKGVLLGGTVVVIYRFLRPALPPAAAATSVLALVLIPEFSWEAQRALTHTVLVVFMSALAISALWRALDRGGLLHWAGFGAVLGAGILSKHNFPILPAGLLMAAVLLPELRQRLRPTGLALAVFVALVMVAPYTLWALANPELAGASLHKLDVAAGGPLAARLTGLGNFAVASLSLLVLPLVALGPFAVKSRPALRDLPLRLRFAAFGALCAVGLLLALVLIAGIAEMRSRWLMPMVWPLVPATVALVWPALPPATRRGLPLACGVLWLVVLAGLMVSSRNSYRAADFSAVDAALPPAQTVLSDHLWLLGNLAFLPSYRPLIHAASGPSPQKDTPLVIAADEGQLADLMGALGLPPATDPQRIDIARGRRMEHIDWTRATAP